MASILDDLSEVLGQIDQPGSFCTSGTAPVLLPGLEVKGLGPVGLPLSARQAKELKAHCTQAPYGKGVETVVDTKVRKVWRIGPDRFSLTNPDWDRFINEIVERVRLDLGLEGQVLKSHVYDLLLYEPGSFFLPHRDGEKQDRMVATLVIVLPSPHEGGQIVVRHDGQERTIDTGTSRGSPFQILFAAFYADCEHEVRPLKKGHRLCLVYNLTLARSKMAIGAPRVSQHIEGVAELLRDWSTEDEPRKLAVPLDHQYSKSGLSWDALKSTDRGKARVLVDAAQQADCQAYLALITKWESGEAEYADGGGYGYGRHGRRSWDDDEDEYEEEGDDGEYEMGEVFDSSLTADHWTDLDGQVLPIGELHLDEDEVVDAESLTEVVAKEDFEGYTGNEGMTLERWYHKAAVFIWPKSRHFEVICDTDGRNVVPLLTKSVARLKKASKKDAPALRAQCLGMARAVLMTWAANTYGYARDAAPTRGLLETLDALDDLELLRAFLGEVLARDVSVESDPSLTKICEKYGWPTFRPQLEQVMHATSPASLSRNVKLLELICQARPRRKEGWNELATSLAEALVSALIAIDEGKGPTNSMGWEDEQLDKDLAGLVRSLIATGQDELLSRLTAHTLANPKAYPLREVQVPAIESLGPWLKKNLKQSCAPLAAWIDSCKTQLEAATAETPQEPSDFRRDAPITCKCKDCDELKRFLDDPLEREHRFSRVQQVRSHLESLIRDEKCDLDCKTEKRGSPHTLVCTKNTASFRRRLKGHHDDLKRLEAIRAIEAKLPERKAGRQRASSRRSRASSAPGKAKRARNA